MARNPLAALVPMIALAGLALTSTPGLAATHWPVKHDYSLEAIDPFVHAGKNVPVTFRVVQSSTGKIVSNATLVEPKLQMIGQHAKPVPGKISALGFDNKGTYQVKGDLAKAGDWRLDSLMQIPGKTAPVHGTLTFRVVP